MNVIQSSSFGVGYPIGRQPNGSCIKQRRNSFPGSERYSQSGRISLQVHQPSYWYINSTRVQFWLHKLHAKHSPNYSNRWTSRCRHFGSNSHSHYGRKVFRKGQQNWWNQHSLHPIFRDHKHRIRERQNQICFVENAWRNAR